MTAGLTGRAQVVQGDAAHLDLPDDSVDLIVTSPPYWGLRDYQDDGGVSLAGQIGSEPTPAEYLAALAACTAEWVRVLRPSGSLFVNLGDKYAGTNARSGGTASSGLGDRHGHGKGIGGPPGGARGAGVTAPGRPKSLMGLPWRYVLACLDDLGLTLRAEIVWNKTNPLPESVTDRVRRQHEQVFHLTRGPRYYSAIDVIRTAPVRDDARASGHRYGGEIPGIGRKHQGLAAQPNHPLGSLPGSVWEIPSQPLNLPAELGVDHFAAFPVELPRRIIAGWSPPGICTACGQGRRPVADRAQLPTGRTNSGRAKRQTADGVGLSRGYNAEGYPHTVSSTTITGWVCACTPYTDHPDRRRPSVTPNTGNGYARDQAARTAASGSAAHGIGWPEREPVREYHWDDWDPAPARPAVVLDPFGGVGTTALAAIALGRDAITVDLSAAYCRAARWRTTDPGQLAAAMGVPKPPPQLDGQAELFSRTEAAQ